MNELRKLLAAATPGPWFVEGAAAAQSASIYGPDGDAFVDVQWNVGRDNDPETDAALIVALCNEAPALLDSLDALEGALGRLIASAQTLETVDDDGEAAEFWTVAPGPLEEARAALDRAKGVTA